MSREAGRPAASDLSFMLPSSSLKPAVCRLQAAGRRRVCVPHQSSCCFSATAFTCVLAQERPPPVEPGDRIRITAPTAGVQRLVGTCVDVSTHTLLVQSVADTTHRVISLASVTRMETTRDRIDRMVVRSCRRPGVRVPTTWAGRSRSFFSARPSSRSNRGKET